MCKLDGLKAAKESLPLPAPFNEMWHRVTKIIDRLHFKNHKDLRCRDSYNPDKAFTKESHPKYDTMICEQTFSWASRFKKIICAMNKTHHLFFLHRMVKRRNNYLESCYRSGRKALFPKPRKLDSDDYTTCR